MTARPGTARLTVALVVLALGCGSHPRISLPPRVSGQIPADYELGQVRAVVLARVSVVTNGQAGFGAITNPLLLQFLPGDTAGGAARTVILPDPDTYVFTGRSEVPSVWRYEAPGLLAMSILPGTYDGLAIAYPDHSHQSATPSSIPAPSRGFVFTPITIPPAAIVYLGDIEIRQQYSFSDLALDRVDVSYAVSDDYDRTVADFRARYPQLADAAVERRLLREVSTEQNG